jgi:heme-degrading monooxygenase HmoA
MFAKINKYCVLKSEAKTFVEMIKLEQKINAVPAGLESYNLFKDRNNGKLYWLTEFWLSEKDYIAYQKVESHKYFLELLKGVLETKHEQHICDIVL